MRRLHRAGQIPLRIVVLQKLLFRFAERFHKSVNKWLIIFPEGTPSGDRMTVSVVSVFCFCDPLVTHDRFFAVVFMNDACGVFV